AAGQETLQTGHGGSAVKAARRVAARVATVARPAARAQRAPPAARVHARLVAWSPGRMVTWSHGEALAG
ncbi:MAG TPA: hypothetical protein VK824_04500, partial [Planctomycetota bacterium]|nr:hypothetical protein [Planctomycetota bacterium]